MRPPVFWLSFSSPSSVVVVFSHACPAAPLDHAAAALESTVMSAAEGEAGGAIDILIGYANRQGRHRTALHVTAATDPGKSRCAAFRETEAGTSTPSGVTLLP
jgi:hypothetical protein